MLITFEGLDGVGKSTQIHKLADFLRHQGYDDLVLTREPGGTKGAEAIRALLLEQPKDMWDAREELLLYSVARHHHIRTLIQPALDEGKLVLCDRFFDSSMVAFITL